ncbi:MAG: Methylmalonyl-CoA mutase small subunit [Planctomycetota bacterium]
MLPDLLKMLDDFPAANLDEWRRVVNADLKGASFDERLITRSDEGIPILPLYTQAVASGLPNSTVPPGLPNAAVVHAERYFERAACDLRPWHWQQNLEEARQAIGDDLQGGATSLWLQFSRQRNSQTDTGNSTHPFSPCDRGLPVETLDDLNRLLVDVPLDSVAIELDAGESFPAAAAMLMALWQQRGIDPQHCMGILGADPLGTLARQGALSGSIDASLRQLGALASQLGSFQKVSVAAVDTLVYHEAGARDDLELAVSMASAVCYLRTLGDAGLAIDEASRQFTFRLAASTNYFRDIAKFRAARALWFRIVTASGGSPESATMQMHVRPSLRAFTRRDPHGNLLRNAAAVFAACVGGAQAITPLPYNVFHGSPAALAGEIRTARRLARNTLLILQHEVHLHQVHDPLRGSWYMEALTSAMAEQAWQRFQEIEQQGGIVAVLESGWLKSRIDEAHRARSEAYARRKRVVIGVSDFVPPPTDEQAVSASGNASVTGDDEHRAPSTRNQTAPQRLAVDPKVTGDLTTIATWIEAVGSGATMSSLSRSLSDETSAVKVASFPLRRVFERFELLQDASDLYLRQSGRRPKVLLCCLGKASEFAPRLAFIQSLLEVGGFEICLHESSGMSGTQVRSERAKALRDSEARVALLCSTDEGYQAYAIDAAKGLVEAGAKVVAVAGKPGTQDSAWREAGISQCIFSGCNVIATLRALLEASGVQIVERVDDESEIGRNRGGSR